jgi:hypothetical protein
MKFYISSRVKHKEEVRRVADLLKKKGYKNTLDWTKYEGLKPYDSNKERSKEFSLKVERAINECDLFILISDEMGTGMHTELGIAMQRALQEGAPKIYIIGNYLSRSVFYFHPVINKANKIEEILDIL